MNGPICRRRPVRLPSPRPNRRPWESGRLTSGKAMSGCSHVHLTVHSHPMARGGRPTKLPASWASAHVETACFPDGLVVRFVFFSLARLLFFLARPSAFLARVYHTCSCFGASREGKAIVSSLRTQVLHAGDRRRRQRCQKL
jgi:hypothetical protein